MSEESRSAKSLFKEVAATYSGVLTAIIVAAVVAAFVAIVADLLYAIVAFLFFLVPQRILERKGEDFRDFGLTMDGACRSLLWGLAFTVLTVPFFVVGYWIWEDVFLEREFAFDWDNYRQWSVEYEGEPEDWGTDAGVWVWSDDDELNVGLRNVQQPNNRVILRADEPFVPTKRGTIIIKPGEGAESVEPGEKARSSEWSVTLTHAKSRGVVTVEGPSEIEVDVEPAVDGRAEWPMYAGPSEKPVEEKPFRDARDTWWIWMWVATQFILIALPEEYFYRGYVQTRLERAFESRAEEQGGQPFVVLGFTPAIVVTSVLFGIGHLLVPVGGAVLAQRVTVFFPSLLFGWLRRHTSSIVGSMVYHAFSNLMVLVAAVHFS